MLEINDLSVTFFPDSIHEKQVLNHISFVVQPGDFVCVIGPNGAGKSTLFNAIHGDIASKGTICLQHQEIQDLPAYQRSKWIGRLYQDPLRGTAPHMTIAENLALALKQQNPYSFKRGISKKESATFQTLLASLQLGLEHQMNMAVGLLSGGQRQALALLMATMAKPRLLLLDEHTASLDPKTAHQVMELSKKFIEENKITTLMITHSIKDALAYGNQLMLVDGSGIKQFDEEAKARLSVQDVLAMYEAS